MPLWPNLLGYFLFYSKACIAVNWWEVVAVHYLELIETVFSLNWSDFQTCKFQCLIYLPFDDIKISLKNISYVDTKTAFTQNN